VHLECQALQSLSQRLDAFRQLRVLVQHIDQNCCLGCHRCLSFRAGPRKIFPVLRVGFRMYLVAVGLAGLSEQDKRRRVGGLQTECKIQKNERINSNWVRPVILTKIQIATMMV